MPNRPSRLLLCAFVALATWLGPGDGLAVESPPTRSPESSARQAPPAARPNVLLIVIDTLRADHLSAYGYDRRTSPTLDRLAAEGILYESCISAASWTLPAHASLFTGLFPRDHRTTSDTLKLDDSFETLAELLAAAGYQTAGFSNNVWTNDASGLKQGFGTFREMWREQVSKVKGISVDDPGLDHGAARTTEEILTWLDANPGPSPYFIFVNYFEPHMPYRPTQPFDRAFVSETADPERVRRMRSFYSPREYGYILNHPTMRLSDDDLSLLVDLYDSEIAYIDSYIDRLFTGLRSRGRLDDTLVIITSDHGEHFGENHMLEHKLSVYDPLLEVPLILWYPGRFPAGARVSTQVQAHDLFGTVLELAGLPAPPARLPLADTARPYTFAELAYPRIFLEVIRRELGGWRATAFARALTTVRGDRYKLIRGSDGSVELYDLEADPLESRNLAAAEPTVRHRLEEVLDAFDRGAAPAPP